MAPTPSKRLRFSIGTLLELPEERSASNSPDPTPDQQGEEPEYYVSTIDCGYEYIDKHKITKLCSKFLIENLPPNPEELLRAIFQKCIDDTTRVATEKQGSAPDRLGMQISSEQLDNPIWVPIRPIHEDTAENALNLFMMIVQSRDKEGKGNVLGAPFTVVVATINAAALPKTHQIRGRGRPNKKLSPVDHKLNYDALILVDNPDGRYCLFHAMELTRKHKLMGCEQFRSYYHYQKVQQYEDVIELMRTTGISMHLPEYDACVYARMVIDQWNQRDEAEGLVYKVFVFGECGHYRPDYVYGPDNFNVPIAIYHAKEHFYGIRNCGALLRKNYKYCFTCMTPYRRDSEHRKDCKARCSNCARVGAGRPCPAEAGFEEKRCALCKRIFRNAECYAHHVQSRECMRTRRCEDCGKYWSVRDNTRGGREGHVCGERYCLVCEKWHDPERGCYIQPLEPKENLPPYRVVCFDMECMQHELDPDSPIEKRIHNVNFISAIVMCSNCMENGRWRHSLKGTDGCAVCGPDRTITFSARPFCHTKVDAQEPGNGDPLCAFTNWLLHRLPAKYSSVCFSHFGGRYDMIIAFRDIFNWGYTPQMIRRGNKMYEMRVRKTKKWVTSINGKKILHETAETIFRDSYNILPTSLGSLVGAFDMQGIEDKPWFPHLANNPENYGRTIPLPPKSAYFYGGMSPEKQAQFDVWYKGEQERGATFNLDETLASYCLNDTRILAEALVAFRKEFAEITGHKLDATRDGCTIASLCMKHFRTNHLKPDHIAIAPSNSYEPVDNQSPLAMKYLNWYAKKHKLDIRTAHSEDGEYRVGPYKVDGYIASQERAIEVNGCIWHAHCCKFDEDDRDFVLPNGKTVGFVREREEARMKFLRTQFRGGVKVVWECDIKKKLAKNPDMKKEFDEYIDDGPIRIRDAFFGGRTGPLRLHYEPPPGYVVAYLDFCSLYPFITATTSFPVGHPKRHVIPRSKQVVNWTRPEQIPVKGLLKVFIVPPKRTIVPVVPAKFDQRLLFPLCRACSLNFPNGGVMPEYRCPHGDDDLARGWEATLTHMELAEALSEDGGYRVIRYFRSLEYTEFDDTIFKGYVSEMMELKFEASGFPEGIDTPEKKEQFIKECYEMFGINIDEFKMLPNKVKRMIVKLLNNNLWGKFAMREGMATTKITDSPAELRRLLDNKSIEVIRVDQLCPIRGIIMITYQPLEEFVEEIETSNIVLSLWVTSAARIHLLKSMRKVVKSGATLLYTDTDSLIFAYKEADGCPLKTGPHLGDLTDEYPSHRIIEYCSGGCKAYLMRMLHKASGEEKRMMRLRGITATGDVCKVLHADTFRDSVLWYGAAAEAERLDGEPIEIDEAQWTIPVVYPNFLRPNIRDGRVCSMPLRKRYRPIVTKGIVTRGLIVKDFGACD